MMKRRTFLTSSLAAAFGGVFGVGGYADQIEGTRDRWALELRIYHFPNVEKRDAFARFIERAAIPALNRIEIQPVGVWTLSKEDNRRIPEGYNETDLFVLIPHRRFDSVFTLIDRLTKDPDFVSAAKRLFSEESLPYERFESSLSLAFTQWPRVSVPTKASDRIAQLRIYESPNDERALAKLDMFNTGGELRIFQKVGLTPVFFGQTLIGTRLPKLTYMLAFPNKEAMRTAWRRFVQDPDWKALSQDPTYKNTVSRITNLILRPTSGSQI